MASALPITSFSRELYEHLLNDGSTLKAIRTAILRNIKGSRTGLVPLLREMADRVEGKVTQPIDAMVTDVEQLTDEELQNEIQRLMEEVRAAEEAGPEN